MDSKFPKFHDGDVMIVLSGGRVYQLHANILRHSSELFARLLPEEHGVTLSSKAKREGMTIRYRLDWVSDGTESGHFVHRVNLLRSSHSTQKPTVSVIADINISSVGRSICWP